jgi:hypothetical protein
VYQGKYISLRTVPRSEFEALRRFPDYTLLQNGVLSQKEPDGYEYRVYDEEVDHFHYGPMTLALQRELQDVYARSWQEFATAQNANSGETSNSSAEFPNDAGFQDDAEFPNVSPDRKLPLPDERSQEEPPA